MRQKLLSSNYEEAIGALRKVSAKGDASLVCVSLINKQWLIRWQAAKEMRELAVRDSIPCLVKALEDNQGLIGGGSEEHSSQEDITRDLIHSLIRLTRLRITEKERYSGDEIENVLAEIKLWHPATTD